MPFNSYFRLLKDDPRLISFGFLMTLGSSFGQTYFIGVFGPAIQSEFDLNHTQWGGIYMIATLASAALLSWTGSFIDRVNLLRYTVYVIILLAISCAFISVAAGVISLTFALFLLRQSGQGLTMHISTTSMSRYFNRDRGRAISLASMGATVGGSLLPLFAVALIASIGWRDTYVVASVLSILFLLPISLLLLKNHKHRHQAHLENLASAEKEDYSQNRSWSRAELLRDPKFYLLIPGFIATDVIVTAMFFHHINLADSRGWTHTWITGNYVMYSAVAMFVTLSIGPLIDRFTARRIAPYVLLPVVLALLLLAVVDAAWVVMPYMLILGLNAGLSYPIMAAIWPELYGVKHIGSIRSIVTPVALFGSALGPVVMGGLIDIGIPIERVCLLFGGYCIFGTFCLWFALRNPAKHS
ncbi:MAG: hypothetical protein CL398_10425 [Acidiferrobacteraceae bacterium]|nr:hypothetical protein [Acidiferrobacteraceae bacterium]|tara:strand:- start:791 stop:2029 length:1239 start_codon:yes stop_codon:yes gene_type:complete